MKKSSIIFLAAVALSLSACGNSAAEGQTLAETFQTTLAETAAGITEAETTETTAAETAFEATETTTVTETEKICTCESEFQHACCEYLNGLDLLAGGIYFGDINGDGTPEAIVERNPFQFTYVLYENENGFQVLNLETVSTWGSVWYIADANQILFSPFFGHTTGTWGYTEYYIYDWNGSDYEVTSSILREAGYYYEDEDGVHSEFGQGYIDDEEVDSDTFEAKLEEYKKLRNENNYFPIVDIIDENFESCLLENFPCFDNWDCFPVKEEDL